MSDNALEKMTEEMRSSLSQLIEHYSGMTPKLRTIELTGIEPGHASCVGFGHELFRGSVTLLTNARDAEQIGGEGTSCIADWLGELGNQAVGRFKNKIAEYGPLMNMGLPVNMSGRDLATTGEETAHWHVHWSNAYLTTIFKLDVSHELVLYKDESNCTAEEGSLCLF